MPITIVDVKRVDINTSSFLVEMSLEYLLRENNIEKKKNNVNKFHFPSLFVI